MFKILDNGNRVHTKFIVKPQNNMDLEGHSGVILNAGENLQAVMETLGAYMDGIRSHYGTTLFSIEVEA